MKRYRPRARGRAGEIKKPFANLTIIVSEKKQTSNKEVKMGQKVNPIGIRLKINRTWDSVWFAKKQNYGTYLIEDFKIRKYINNTIKNSGVSKILIERPSKNV